MRVLFLALLLLPSVAFPQAVEIVSLKSGECALTLEANEKWRTLRLRVHPEGQGCGFDKEAVIPLLRSGFSKTDPPRLEGPYTSLDFGRIVDYPWLSRYLSNAAAADPAWDRKRGRPVRMDINKYVKTLLSAKEVTGPVDAAVSAGGYKVVSVTVEKVLIDPGRRVPFDAILWFHLRKD